MNKEIDFELRYEHTGKWFKNKKSSKAFMLARSWYNRFRNRFGNTDFIDRAAIDKSPLGRPLGEHERYIEKLSEKGK